MKRKVAVIISRVFNPVILIPVMIVGVISYAYINGHFWQFFILMFFLDAVLPGIMVFWHWWRSGKRDFDIFAREERIPALIVTVICHGIGVLMAFYLQQEFMAKILLGLWLLALIYASITVFWKISIHAGVNATMATLIMVMFGWQYWWVWLIVVLVAWARVVDKDHSVEQVIVGSLIPPLLLFPLYGYWGIW